MAHIVGTPSDDTLNGTAADDLIEGLEGNDILLGGGGNDALRGGAGNDQLYVAAGGNNVLEGGPGDDSLVGQDGFDTAIFSAAVASYHFADSPFVIGAVTVTGPDGADALVDIDQLNFANLSFSIADRSHFDPLYYLEHNPDVAAAAVDPLNHYRNVGWTEGRDPSADVHLASVNGLEYIASYGDLIGALGANKPAGYKHFATTGLFEGRTISFDGLEYIASYGDLITPSVLTPIPVRLITSDPGTPKGAPRRSMVSSTSRPMMI